jgi:anti-anti-sigma factor
VGFGDSTDPDRATADEEAQQAIARVRSSMPTGVRTSELARSLERRSIAMTSMGDGRSHFQMAESFDEAGVLCLSLIGELDLAVADDLAVRLHQLQAQRLEVRLDLTQLEFIDSTGLRELMCAIDSSRRDGSRLTVGTEMTRAVRRVVELVGVGPYFRSDGE